MDILVINPNSTVAMTDKIALAARRAARAGTNIHATEARGAPASIQGFYDVALCQPALLSEILQHPGMDAVVIACFDDTALDAARCLVDCPVIGIGEAGFHIASMLSCRFSVVTTLRRSVPGIEANLQRYGLAARCGKVRASDVPVLALERREPAMMLKITTEIEKALTEDGAEAIVLGCSGMADLAQELSDRYGVPVIDGVAAAVALAEALVSTGLKTSRVGGYGRADR